MFRVRVVERAQLFKRRDKPDSWLRSCHKIASQLSGLASCYY